MGKTTDYSSIQNSDEMLEAITELIHTIIPQESYLLVGESYGGYLARGIMRKSVDQLLGTAFICPSSFLKKNNVRCHHIVLYKQTLLFINIKSAGAR